MPGILTPEPPDLFLYQDPFTEDDWLEAVNLHSPSQLSMGRKASNAALTGYIPFNRINSAVAFFLGFSYVAGTGTSRILSRSQPALHPIFPGMVATMIQETTGLQFVSKSLTWPVNSLPYATYNMWKVTVAYSQPNYVILPDWDDLIAPRATGCERLRYTYDTPKPYVDQLVVPGGTMLFDATGQPFNGKPAGFGTQVTIRSQKSATYLTWYNVPIDWVATDNGVMTTIVAAMGKINSDVFMGEQPHIWLLDDVEPTDSQVYADPIATDVFSTLSKRIDIKFTFKYFNPPVGAGSTTDRGWRVQPAYNGNWYRAYLQQDNAISWPLETSFNALFDYRAP